MFFNLLTALALITKCGTADITSSFFNDFWVCSQLHYASFFVNMFSISFMEMNTGEKESLYELQFMAFEMINE